MFSVASDWLCAYALLHAHVVKYMHGMVQVALQCSCVLARCTSTAHQALYACHLRQTYVYTYSVPGMLTYQQCVP